jgi:hypothetical protein
VFSQRIAKVCERTPCDLGKSNHDRRGIPNTAIFNPLQSLNQEAVGMVQNLQVNFVSLAIAGTPEFGNPFGF